MQAPKCSFPPRTLSLHRRTSSFLMPGACLCEKQRRTRWDMPVWGAVLGCPWRCLYAMLTAHHLSCSRILLHSFNSVTAYSREIDDHRPPKSEREAALPRSPPPLLPTLCACVLNVAVQAQELMRWRR